MATTKKKRKTPKVDWKHMDDDILNAIRNLRKFGYTEPTIRSVFYVLGTLEKIPLTSGGYKRLDAKMVQMRRDGTIPWGFFAVKRGRSISAGGYWSPELYARASVHQLKNAHTTYSIPRWFGQSNLVEIWVEKDGLLGATANWTSDLEVTVRAPQGQGAWEFIHDAMKSISKELEEQSKDEVHILYLGDLDPSGMRIPEVMQREGIPYFEEHLGLDEIDFEVIALTPEQVTENNLPDMPETDEVLAKIHRDSNLRWYRERYPEMFTELDAFYALATTNAQALLRSEVESFFDEGQYAASRELEAEGRKTVERLVKESVTFKDDKKKVRK